MFQFAYIPLLTKGGGCGINQKSRSHRRAADGVVAHATCFRNAFRNTACERPPRPRLFRNGSILLMAQLLLRLRPIGLALRALLCTFCVPHFLLDTGE